MEARLNELVRIGVAADMLGVTPQTVRNWTDAGVLDAVRHPVNGYRLFDASQVERLAASTLSGTPWQSSLFPESTDVDERGVTTEYKLSSLVASRLIRATNGVSCINQVDVADDSLRGDSPAERFDNAWLRQVEKRSGVTAGRQVTIGDAFCGGGIFSLGVDEALRGLSMLGTHAFGIDFKKDAIATFAHNFPEAAAIHDDVVTIAGGRVGSKENKQESTFVKSIGGGVDILIGGPPCQGHSDLNNHSRRADPKNALYFSMARLAELLQPTFVMIENVPGVVHDKGGVVPTTEAELARLGYHVSKARFDLRQLGVPQKRKRFILVASKIGPLDLDAVLDSSLTSARPVSWAIDDLIDSYDESSVYDSSATHSEENKRRIAHLFAHNLYELPNELRPPCHRDKKHSYNSVYGRMRWDEPAPTITGGFGSTGQGRFVHPTMQRTLTPHEACRVQFVPDYFQFPESVGRRSMQQIIGNAAPPRLSEALVIGAAMQGVLL